MTLKSGWCIGPDGARGHHEACPSKRCVYPCHLDADRLIAQGIHGMIGAQDGPEPLATIRGRDRLSRSQS